MVRIGLVNNLRAGRNRRRVAKIRALLARYPEVRHVETERSRSSPGALAELTSSPIDLLILNGGDGTLQHALTELLSNAADIPWIAPLRGGSTNMAARDLGAHRDPVVGLERVLRAASDGHLDDLRVDRPVLRVASSVDTTAQYGMFFGAGMVRRAIELTHRFFPRGRGNGLFGARLVTSALIAKALTHPTRGILTPDKAEILIDGSPVSGGEFYLVVACSVQRLFMGMNPFWGDGSGDVRFTSLASRVQGLGTALPGILRGRPSRRVRMDDGYTSANAERVELRLDCGYTVDGEIFAPRCDERITITADRRVQFIRA